MKKLFLLLIAMTALLPGCATLLPPPEAAAYEVNSSIPDYSSVTGRQCTAENAPDNIVKYWHYSYKYDAAELGKYTKYLQSNGFEVKHSVGTEVFYYVKGMEGVYTIRSGGTVFIAVYEEGTVEEAITSKNGAWYKENESVPNYGEWTDMNPIRFDAGYVESGDTQVRYLYPIAANKSGVGFEKRLSDCGFFPAGSMPVKTNGPVSKTTYINSFNEMMAITADHLLGTMTVAFTMTNEAYIY